MSERYSPNRDMQELCEEAITAGWTVERTGGQHLRLVAPSGAFVFGPSTPSDWRSVHAVRAKMRRAWPGWDGRVKREPRYREKRPGRTPEQKTASAWDGRDGNWEPLPSTLADVWPKVPA